VICAKESFRTAGRLRVEKPSSAAAGKIAEKRNRAFVQGIEARVAWRQRNVESIGNRIVSGVVLNGIDYRIGTLRHFHSIAGIGLHAFIIHSIGKEHYGLRPEIGAR